MQVDLEVLWLTDEQIALDELGMMNDLKYDLSPTKTHTFYTINFIRDMDEIGYCQIGSNGEEFIIRESIESVKDKINHQIVFKMN